MAYLPGYEIPSVPGPPHSSQSYGSMSGSSSFLSVTPQTPDLSYTPSTSRTSKLQFLATTPSSHLKDYEYTSSEMGFNRSILSEDRFHRLCTYSQQQRDGR